MNLLLSRKFIICVCKSLEQSIHACIHYMLSNPWVGCVAMYMMFIGRGPE